MANRFFSKKLQKFAYRLGAWLPVPHRLRWLGAPFQDPVCNTIELHWFTQHVSQARHLHFLTVGFFLSLAKTCLRVKPGHGL